MVLMIVAFLYVSIFLYVFSHANDFKRSIKSKSDSLSILLLEKVNSLSKIDAYFKNSGIVYSENQDLIMNELSSISLVDVDYNVLFHCINIIKKAESALSLLCFDHPLIAEKKEFGLEKVRLEDLDRNFRAGMALYNADVNAYNYWLSIPGYRLVLAILGFKKKKTLS